MCFSANGKTSNHTLMPYKDKLCRRGVFFVYFVQSGLLSQLLRLNYIRLLLKLNIKYYGFFVHCVQTT